MKVKTILALSFAVFTATCGPLAPAQVVQEEIDVTTLKDGTVVFVLSPAAAAKCLEQGGCAVISRDYFRAAIARQCGVSI